MGRKPKIDFHRLKQLLEEGKTHDQISQVFGVHPSAVTKAVKKLKVNVDRVVALERTDQSGTGPLDMMQQLRKVSHIINTQLDWAADQVARTPDEEKGAMQGIIVKLAAEIRAQLETYLRVAQIWHDQKIYAEFQEEVLNYLEELSPGARDAIIKGLKDRSILRRPIQSD